MRSPHDPADLTDPDVLELDCVPRWTDQMPLLIDLAVADLDAGRDVLPTMVAFRGDQPLFLVTLRPFAGGEHHDPIIEAGALALALHADRVLLSLAGRAWSTQDPIPPVLPGAGDLRQPVIVVHQADATTDDPIALTTVVPVDRDGGAEGGVVLGAAMSDLSAAGWVPQVLLALVAAADDGPRDPDELAIQVRRCLALGHRIAWSPSVREHVERVCVPEDAS
jgi:hypothetical protein